MNSIRFASVVASFAFGLVGYASQALAETPAAGFDPSSIYTPSPNSRPLAVQPPVGVTGSVGGNLRTVPAKSSNVASYNASSFYQPNERPLAVQPPVAVTGVVGSPESAAPVRTAKPAPKVAPVPVSTTSTTSATFYNPSPNERTVVLTAPAMTAPARIESTQPAMALQYTTASSFYNPSPNYTPMVVATPVVATAANASKASSREPQAISSLYNPSPNARPAVVSAPAAETRVATQAAQQRTAALRVSASEGMPGISPNVR